MSEQTPTPADQTPWPSPASGWIVVGLLALASVVSQFDRTVINLAVAPIKAQFALDDTHFGMLQGVAFGIFYMVACVPIGRLADRHQRRLIIGVGLGLFSLFSMGSGLTRTYAQLFLTRIGVGVGEASLTPAGMSMLADHFPPERLGQASGAFLMSAPVGQGLAFMIGGGLLQWLSTTPVLAGGPMSGFQPWQAAFVIIGFPGLLLAPLFLALREPARRGAGREAGLPLREAAAVLIARAPALAPMFAGFSMVTLVSYTFFIWTPALFERAYGWSPGQIGLAFGLIVIGFGTGGAFFGGWMSDRLGRRGHTDAPLKVAAFGFVGCGVFGALAPLAPSPVIALALLAPAIFLSNTPYACAVSSIQMIVPNRARAQVTALYVTLTTFVGLVIGPLVVGLMTDHLFRGPADIRYALALVVACAALPMMTLMLLACRPYRALRASQPGEAENKI